MSKYRHLVYMVLDELKGMSDDFSYTEEHIIFLLSKYRATILKNTYKNKEHKIPKSNDQTVCIELEESPTMSSIPCSDNMLRSSVKIPQMLDVGDSSVFPVSFLSGANIAFISEERMNFVGYNRLMQNIIYAAVGKDNYLYLKSSNPQFMYLEQVKLNAVFEDIEKASELQCSSEENEESSPCDLLDREFPIEDSLIPILIETIVKKLTGDIYKPKDSENNASDDLAGLMNGKS